MDPQLFARIETLEKKIDAIYISAEKTRKYILTMVVITVVTLVLPLVLMIAVLPSFMSSYTTQYEELLQ
jgi:type II secretory pathway component PulF